MASRWMAEAELNLQLVLKGGELVFAVETD